MLEPPESQSPVISVLLPTYHSEQYILETLKSLLAQTEEHFEILLLDEADSRDQTCVLAESLQDPRIQILSNEKHLGLAETLNRGIKLAQGEFIARADAGDLYPKDRFEKQLAYLRTHPEVGVCGSWQHHFGPNKNWIHQTPERHDEIKAQLIYNCEMCHSTVMIRKSVLFEHDLCYDSRFAAEDYEFWCRIVFLTKVYNLPEVLGEYRWDGNNITQAKMRTLRKESACLAERNIREHLGVQVPESHVPLLDGWENEFIHLTTFSQYSSALQTEQNLLRAMWEANKSRGVYETEALLRTLERRWYFVTGLDKYGKQPGTIENIEALFRKHGHFSLYFGMARLREFLKLRLKHGGDGAKRG